jgi:hypothetical protein
LCFILYLKGCCFHVPYRKDRKRDNQTKYKVLWGWRHFKLSGISQSIELIKSREDYSLQPIILFRRMGLMDILCASIFLFTVVESTSRSGSMWPHNVGVESTGTVSWTVFSASIFVLVALVLSMYLIFEHLAAYNQPEVDTCVHLLFTFDSYLFFLLHQKIYHLCNAYLYSRCLL